MMIINGRSTGSLTGLPTLVQCPPKSRTGDNRVKVYGEGTFRRVTTTGTLVKADPTWEAQTR